ncbi:MAG: gamma-glutamyl-gamma-aminobutyrate hydrolase family protein [Candidatus Omnitrophota bacterium]
MRGEKEKRVTKKSAQKPIIGLTCEVIKLKPYFAEYELACDYRYVRSVLRAGGLPLLIPNNPYRQLVSRILDDIDGLLITGGADVHPFFYGEPRTKKVRSVYRGRFYFERLLYGLARKRKIPVLGICYGMQLINVIHGGTLYQDIRTAVKGANNHCSKRSPLHLVTIMPGTICEKIFGKSAFRVHSEHHQAVKKIGHTLNIGAVSSDGIIEAVEKDDRVFAVQWHPERQAKDLIQQKLFNYFISLAGRRRTLYHRRHK